MNQSTSFAHWASKCASICTFNKNRYYLFLINFLLTLGAANAWGATWKLVTDASTLKAGDELIFVSSKGFVAGDISSNIMASVAVTISDNTISELPDEAVIMTLGGSSGAWTFTNSNGKLLGATALKKVAWGSGTTTWSISISSNNATIQNATSSYGRFLYNVNSPRFTTYTSNASASMVLPQIYKKASTTYDITNTLSHVTANPDNPTFVSSETADLNLYYTAENNTWNLPANITVTMGGTPLSNEDYIWDQTSGELLIGIENDFAFTGDIAITINGWQQLATPTELNSECTSTSATLKWNSVPNASSYLVTIVDGGELSADVPNTKTLHTFEGLNPSTEYLWVVKAIGDGTTYIDSEESATGEFKTLSAGYTITYNTNGGDAIAAASGTALPNPLPPPTKDHYEFQGWYTDEDCTQAATAGATINADITLYAKWEAVTYTITLVPNYPNSLTGVFKDKGGNTIADNLVIPIKYGTTSQPLTIFYSTLSLDGYQFDAFYTQTEGGQKRVNTGTLTKDLTLYARWKKEYTVTWNVNGKNTGTTIIVEGKEWTLPEVDESCNGKQFVGWTTTEILEEQDNAPAILYTETSQFPLETNTYYAVFANVEVTGTGEYVKLTEALTDYSGEYLIVYEDGKKAFNGGLGESSLDGNDNYISITISDNVVQATDAVEKARFIVAKVDGGYSIQSASGLYIGRSANSNGMDFAQIYNADLVNTFPNYSTIRGKGGTDIQYNNNTQPSQQNRFRYYASSLNTIALYKKTGTNMTNYTTSCVPTYTITWKNDDDTVLETDKVKENTTPTYDGTTPTKEADAQYTYTFDDWDPAIVEATEDATYTATYTATVNKYTITWKNEDGTVLETDNNVPYGETPTYNGATPTKTATAQYTYTFNAWTPEVTSVTGNATYKATFTETINLYQVTFNMDDHGTAPVTQTIAYGSKVSEPSAPTADGYEFAGWYKDAQCTTPWDFDTDVITGNTTIHAKWLQIFTITWKANGLEYTTTNATEGEPITPPASPDPGDYCGQVFAGWTDAEMEETTNVAPTLYPNPTPFPTATKETPTTFYAVFADYEN